MSWLPILIVAFISQVYAADLYVPWIISAGPTYASYKFNVLQHLASISPYFEFNSDGLNPDPPQGCKVSKVAYLMRHGSIYVNDNHYFLTIEPFLKRLNSSSSSVDFSNTNNLAFLTNWTSPISNSREQIEELTRLGFLESFQLGTRLAYRYPNLLPVEKDSPFKVWASDSNRTLRSAYAVFAGLHAGHDMIGKVVNVSEDANQGANTLTPRRTCPKFSGSNGWKMADIWLNYYAAPIIARFTAEGSGFQFSAQDILAMQELCGYETIIRGFSPLCGLFTSEEWLAFEYFADIKYYYELGYGNVLSPSLGMPWVVAATDLLSQTGATDQQLYIAISHRQMPPFVLTALGLFNDSDYVGTTDINRTLPLNEINEFRAWKTSNFLSFMSHIALERLECATAAFNGPFVRVLVNSKPKPLPRCRNGPGASCPLEQYNAYVKRRRDSYDSFSRACGFENQNFPEKLSFLTTENVV